MSQVAEHYDNLVIENLLPIIESDNDLNDRYVESADSLFGYNLKSDLTGFQIRIDEQELLEYDCGENLIKSIVSLSLQLKRLISDLRKNSPVVEIRPPQ